ncbi:MAG TPA: hypothetical protein PK265_01385, partial [Candidatus Saccharibacteria bacterium]|nr:hypothetical protein [Candidatus Saccharibacteria bacterium]
LINIDTANAAVWDGRSWRWNRSHTQYYSQSYFSGTYDYSMEGKYGYYSAVVPTANLLRSGSDAIPSSINTVDELVDYLKALNRTGGSSIEARWKRAGSAFVVHSMLGRNGNQANSNGGRHISDATFENLRDRLNSAKSINWNTAASTDGINTESSYNSDVDVQAYRHTKTDIAIVIIDSNNNSYKLFRHCANPVGALTGIAESPKDYNLTPLVNVNRQSSESGGTVKVTPVVNNSGRVKSSNTYWTISSMAYAPNASVPNSISTDQKNSGPDRACDYYRSSGAQNCENTVNGVGSFSLGTPSFYTSSSGSSFDTKDLIVGDYEVGTRVCYGLSVFSRNEKTGSEQTWAHSIPICLVVGKKPKVQVWGGDLLVGRYFIGQTPLGQSSNVTASVSMKTVSGEQHAFGSWIEYGIFSSGSITGVASESAFSGPSGMLVGDPSNACDYSQLSFTNVDPNSAKCNDIGNYSLSGSIPDIGSNFPVNSSTARLRVAPASNDIVGLNGVYTADGNIHITSSGDISKGRWIVINTPGSIVTINGNITYTPETLNKLEDIPQVIIVAKDILIAGNVTRVDAWLVASDTVNTCSSVSETASLSVEICNNSLIVNGPVMASKIFLRRTAGSGTGNSSGDPAEIFNLRADAYLWAVNRSLNLGRAQTIFNTELPPRF